MAADSEALWHPLIGMALGGGLAHGFAHIGVPRALEKHGIVPDIVIGTSIGAVVGAAYLAGAEDVELSMRIG
jgi:NTE family protein